jgi:hypothetical protein
MSHGCTEDARQIDNWNPAARAHSDLSLPGHTNGHEDQRPPDSGEMNTALAPTTIYGDPHTYEEVMLSPQKKKWEAAIMAIYKVTLRNGIVEPVHV